jgi:hypothetical protein
MYFNVLIMEIALELDNLGVNNATFHGRQDIAQY